MTNWRAFERTVSPTKWARIKYYIEEAEDSTEPSDYGVVSLTTWYDVALVLSKHENELTLDKQYGPLIADYEMFWDSMAGIDWP